MKIFLRMALIIFGTVSIGLGIVGIFLPLLPTTPFLLLGAACYIRGSQRLYSKLMGNRWLGNYIRNYREGNGIPLKTKITAVALLWASISYSAFFMVSQFFVQVILFSIALGVTAHLISLKTLRKEEPYEHKETKGFE